MKVRLYILILAAVVLLFNCGNTCNAMAYTSLSSEGDITICIDPGHQGKGDNRGEPVAPNSSEVKPRVSAGTSGVGTKKAEHMVNLEASKILKDKLLNKGYNVIMTREETDVNISNKERAEIANNANADLCIRIHCDSISNGSKTGATILVPSQKSTYTSNIYEASYKYAEFLKKELENNNIKVNCIVERNDITGFNWSKVPVIILEMGFMSNYNEDRMLCSSEYQSKLMECVASAIDQYAEIN